MVTCTTDPADSACIACAKDSCCAETTACLEDASCAACVACIDTAADPTTCLDSCDLNAPVTAAVYNCTSASCQADCFAGADACAPSKTDDACTTCAKESCCDAVTACQMSAQCIACLQCVGTAATPTDCLGNGCSLSDPATTQLLGCAQQSCAVCLN